LGSGEDDFWQLWNVLGTRDGKSVAQIIPECDFELGAGLGEAEEGVAAVAAEITARAAAELAPGDVAADVIFRSVGVQGDVGSLKHQQELTLLCLEPAQEPVERGIARLRREDLLKALDELSLALGCGLCAIGLEIGVEGPDAALDVFFGLALLVGEGIELVYEAFRMDSTPRVGGNIELTGAIRDDDCAIKQPLGGNGAP
jgi:hypothetical protein